MFSYINVNKYFFYSIAAILVVVVGHFASVLFGGYSRTFWMDMVLHFFAGISISFGFLGLFLKKGMSKRNSLEIKDIKSYFTRIRPAIKNWMPFVFLLMILSAYFGSLVWEVYEFIMYQFFPEYMQYFFSVIDILSDIIFGILGGILAATIFSIKTYQ